MLDCENGARGSKINITQLQIMATSLNRSFCIQPVLCTLIVIFVMI